MQRWKTRDVRWAKRFRIKLFIAEHESYESIEHRLKSKIGKIFVNEEILEEYSGKIYEIDRYFSENYKKKIQVDKNGQQYIFFTIDIFFTKYCLAVEIDKKGQTDRDFIFEKKRQKPLEKKNVTVHVLELILVKKILM